MEYNYPKFTPEMKKTHTILIPNMAITQFRLLEYALRYDGYKCEILGNCGSAVAQLGLKYVHNDTCYPALLVIGQFLDALNSGKYDLEHTALLITQTGGGCRASNYIHLLRKALVKAGYPNIPVASLNFSGLEKDSGFQMTLPLARRAIASVFYGDMLCALRNQVAPYENEKGAADKMVDLWVQRLGRVLLAGKGFTSREMKHTFPLIAKDFKSIPVTRVPKVKVGVVGEIYVKYSPLGNNDLQKFLESQDCEVNFPGLMGFVQYCIFNMGEDHVLYGGKLAMKMGTDQLLNWLDSVERSMLKAEADAGFYAPGPFKELVEKPEGIISLGAKMGEGWLLTAEMIELVQGGYGNIICAQPFGCLPNHIVGKGMVNKIRAMYPGANITPIDYDPSATRVNQENRIKLMLAVAKERLNAPAEAKPLTAEEIAGVRPACPTSEKLQKKQRSRTVQLFAVLCGFSYAPERLFLVILAVFLLIGGLAGEVHPQTLDGVRIHAGQDDRGVHIAALELGELLQSGSSRLILGGRAGQRDQDLIGVQAGIPAAEVVGLEGLDGLDGAGGD